MNAKGGIESILECFADSVVRYPHRVALEEAEGWRFTYEELAVRAAGLAERLKAVGVRSGDTVALCLPRSAEYVIALLGAWLVGAVALPIDPAMPEARRRFILDQARPKVTLTSSDAILAASDTAKLGPITSVQPGQPAYLIYTSGSTGQPKGVLVSHDGLVRVLRAQVEFFQIRESSRCFWMHGLGFDASFSDLGTALVASAALCFSRADTVLRDPERLIRCVSQLGITHWDIPPSLLSVLHPEHMPETLTTLIIGGEICPPQVVRRWATQYRLINVYGPTEATICTSMVQCGSNWERPFIGAPLDGVRYHIMNANGESVAEGVPGELWIEGSCVALGYPFAPELSAQRFDHSGGSRLYRTGDRVARTPEGWEFLGRLDRQIKVHGKLVSPEEVEAVLCRLPGVRRAVVLRDERGDAVTLAACVEVSRGFDVGSLKAQATANLPDWLVPARWLVVEDMPRLATGKPDEATILRRLQETTSPCFEHAPLSELEATLAELFAECLGCGAVGRDADFFDLGGDSLALMKFLGQALRRGLRFSANSVHQARTVSGLVRLLNEHHGGDERLGREDLYREVAKQWPTLSLKLAPCPAATSSSGVDSILLTGATGFLGGAVLGHLLRGTDAPLVCLVRDVTDERAFQRLADGLVQHGFQELLPALKTRCQIYRGNLGESRLGLSTPIWARLVDEIDQVFHLAGDVRLFHPLAELAPANVDGTREVIAFCLQGRPKRLHHASTLAVFVDADPPCEICLEKDLRESIEWVHGGYSQSKWVAEQLVLKAFRENGLMATIYRLGLLTANSQTGHAPDRDWLVRFIREAASGEVTRSDSAALHFDVTPVDFAAKAMVTIARHPETAALIHHVSSGHPISWAELHKIIQQVKDVSSQSTNHLTFEAERLCTSRSIYRSLNLFKATQVRFDLRNTLASLDAAGICLPSIDTLYLELLVRSALYSSPP